MPANLQKFCEGSNRHQHQNIFTQMRLLASFLRIWIIYIEKNTSYNSQLERLYSYLLNLNCPENSGYFFHCKMIKMKSLKESENWRLSCQNRPMALNPVLWKQLVASPLLVTDCQHSSNLILGIGQFRWPIINILIDD